VLWYGGGREGIPLAGLNDTSLIRSTYRALLRSNRSYAAFTAADRLLIERLAGSTALLDPMSGYGSLTHLAVARNQSSFCLELNQPQFLWQVLTHPRSRETVLTVAKSLRGSKLGSKAPSCAIMSESFFPEESRRVVRELRHRVQQSFDGLDPGPATPDLVDALMLPFVGRLACVRPSFNPAHVKRGGGICVLKDWQVDFRDYVDAVISLLERLPIPSPASTTHGLELGDARSFRFELGAYDGLLTSPPYPNRADYASLFLPESDYLSWVRESSDPTGQSLIGSVIVSHRSGATPSASTALRFLDEADDHARARGKRAEYDQRVYYRPYFEEYFGGLEAAWRNVATALAPEAHGFIVVVNNTHRGLVIPVAEFACEVWQGLGFDAAISDTSEHTHVGTKNPRARGVRAVHSRHVVEIGRSRR
jgi:hypothetical protein